MGRNQRGSLRFSTAILLSQKALRDTTETWGLRAVWALFLFASAGSVVPRRRNDGEL